MPDANGQNIINWVNTKNGTQVGTGECFDLADLALREVGARSASSYGPVTPNGDYVWGTSIPASTVRAGDVLQYRNWSQTTTVSGTTKFTFPGGTEIEIGEDSTASIPRPHHTAVVSAAPANGVIAIMEQNVDRGSGMERRVGAGQIRYQSQPATRSSTTERVQVNAALGRRMKEGYDDAEYCAMVDRLIQQHSGTMIEAVSNVTTTITVTGTLNAYRPQMP